MPPGADVALAATLHDVSGALTALIRRALPVLRRRYRSVAVATSPTTAPVVNALLADAGVLAGTPRANVRGPLYRLAVRHAVASAAHHVHYLDFDRALHWVATRPAELAALLRMATREPALLIGRTITAHRSHQRALFETERAVNTVFAARLGLMRRVDFLVPSFVLRRQLAVTLLRRSRARDVELYGEWPALLVTLGGPLAYVECRGLDWETPDRHATEVRRIGLARWRRSFDTAEEWRMRRAMADAFERGFRATLARRFRAAPGRHHRGVALRVLRLRAPAR